MFSWYKNASMCYAYLSDVPDNIDLSKDTSKFELSRWFTRGWTLQELIAPPVMMFYSDHWQFLGSKLDLCELLTTITGIEEAVLKYRNLESICVAKKMSWASKRKTTRIEDTAYCLLGIFDVNMPLLYGEGSKAFTRLQEEIMKVYDDQSLFAWGLSETPSKISYDRIWHHVHPPPELELQRDTRLLGIFAESPKDFASSGAIKILPDIRQENRSIPVAYNRGVNIHLPLLFSRKMSLKLRNSGIREFSHICFYEESLVLAILDCTIESDNVHRLALPLRAWSPRYFGRSSQPVLVDSNTPDLRTLQIKSEPSYTEFLGGKFIISIINWPRDCGIGRDCASSAKVFGTFFSKSPVELVSYEHIPGTHGVLRFYPSGTLPFAITFGGYIRADGNESDLWVSFVGSDEISSEHDFSDLLNENTDAFKRMRKESSTSLTKRVSDNIVVTVKLGDVNIKFRHWAMEVEVNFQIEDDIEHESPSLDSPRFAGRSLRRRSLRVGIQRPAYRIPWTNSASPAPSFRDLTLPADCP